MKLALQLLVLAGGVAFTGTVMRHDLSPDGRLLQRRHAALHTWNARKTDKSCVMTCPRSDAKGCSRWVTLCRGDAGWPPPR